MPSRLKEWKALTAHAEETRDTHMRDLFTHEKRFDKFHASIKGLLFDYSRHRANDETISLLMKLARARDVEQWRDRMFTGDKINNSENRAVLHTALRGSVDKSLSVDGENVSQFVDKTLAQVKGVSDKIRADKKITDVVNIGIGGSDLGARIVYETLQDFRDGPRVHFVSNIDGARISGVLKGLKPESTVFIVVSKTFTTMETLANAQTAKKWAGDAKNFYAVTMATKKAEEFGITDANILPMREWIGGRFSLWSGAGLSIAIAKGFESFQKLLDGARMMDKHFRTAPLEKNLPVLMAMLGVWYRNFMGFPTYAVLPYAHNLRKLPAFLQQLDMESNGKSVDRDGQTAAFKTGALLFGETGTNAQHAFMQLMHQGSDIIPADFIVVKKLDGTIPEHHKKLNANALAQAQALMQGDPSPADPHRAFAGNRPSSTLVMDRLDPWHLGQVLALYEHKVFVQGIVWNINSFDQWGVELGKTIANGLLENPDKAGDQTTRNLLRILQE